MKIDDLISKGAEIGAKERYEMMMDVIEEYSYRFTGNEDFKEMVRELRALA